MDSLTFESLVEELRGVADDLPEWIPMMDSDILRFLPTSTEKRKWLRRAKAEITRRAVQERVDEIAEAWECEDKILVSVLLEAFPKDLALHKLLKPSQRQMWIDKAHLAACGRGDEPVTGEPLIYFVSSNDDLVKIGHTTNLQSRLRSLRTATPKELRILLCMPGTRDDEQELHRRFLSSRVGREWFTRAGPIDEFIASRTNKSDLDLSNGCL